LPQGPLIDVDLGTNNFDEGLGNWGCAVTAGGEIDCFGAFSNSWLVPSAAP